ncbi:MAG: RHS repeat domain-containing protein [Candidatus Omnitrophota bacterium]
MRKLFRGNTRFIFVIIVYFILLVNIVNAVDFTYIYDYLNRLTSVTYCDGSSITYTYDANGNRTLLNITAATKTLTVIFPNTNAVLPVNSIQTLTWTSTNLSGNVNIFLTRDNGATWETLFTNTANDGTEAWTVNGKLSTQCKVRIESLDCGTVRDDSDTLFTIAAAETPTLSLTSPNGGESWQANTSHTITWTHTGNIKNVKIEYSANNGSGWTTITQSIANTHSYQWTLPNKPSKNCLVKISDTSNSTVNDISNSVFTILPPNTITVTAPNGGEKWRGGSTHSITWTSTGTIANVNIQYSTDNGNNWSIVAANTPNTKMYSWEIPNTVSQRCLIKISDASNSNIYDVSNAAFSITAMPSWQKTIIDTSAGQTDGRTTILIGNDNWPRICYTDTSDLKYAQFNGTTWAVQTIDTNVAGDSAMAIKSNGNPVIAYNKNWEMFLASWNGTSWDIQEIDADYDWVDRPNISIKMDSVNHPSIVFSSGNDNLNYLSYNGSDWTNTVVDSNVSPHVSHIIDTNNVPIIAYCKFPYNHEQLWAARLSGSNWELKAIDKHDGNSNRLGYQNSIKINSNGEMGISYYDLTIGDLKYAHNLNWNGNWTIETLDSAGDVGDFSSLYYFNSLPHIAYIERGSALKYIFHNGSTWNKQSVDMLDSRGSSMTMDSAGGIHISYYDMANHSLKYAYLESSGVQSDRLD